MDFLQLAENRYSVRNFADKEIEQEKIDAILRAGQVAPTACNFQPQKILVIKSKEALEKFRRCTVCHFNAPLAILTCYDKSLCWSREYDGKTSGDIDAAIITTHMMLEAANLGIGSTWVMHFIPEAIREEFKLPDNFEPVSILVMGYPAEGASPNPSHFNIKPLSDTVFYNEY
ncbi:nitroreductase family protein [Ruminiclostridium herbifermentans]|uniref:Nitroreductase family protein n=1 Tax=Ruminiclostridium herbifermentans TaxID=2488810 RepID=A0A4U7JHN4_9FIRM|nr:nitroreductase family protein [Ruminiclostridium herbifermentans]QNU66220.1 nitroreductase family protein [Ruminiclostridium herbifermentans]